VSIVTQAKMEECLMFLASTDDEYGRLRALVNGLERQTKTIKALAFRGSRESSVAAKEQDAYCSPAYVEHIKKIEIAEREMLILGEQRNTQTTWIDCWRSVNKAQYQGTVQGNM
jgi:hypothetical protein